MKFCNLKFLDKDGSVRIMRRKGQRRPGYLPGVRCPFLVHKSGVRGLSIRQDLYTDVETTGEYKNVCKNQSELSKA